jgi:hypothetical protein
MGQARPFQRSGVQRRTAKRAVRCNRFLRDAMVYRSTHVGAFIDAFSTKASPIIIL